MITDDFILSPWSHRMLLCQRHGYHQSPVLALQARPHAHHAPGSTPRGGIPPPRSPHQSAALLFQHERHPLGAHLLKAPLGALYGHRRLLSKSAVIALPVCARFRIFYLAPCRYDGGQHGSAFETGKHCTAPAAAVDASHPGHVMPRTVSSGKVCSVMFFLPPHRLNFCSGTCE